MAKCDIQVLFSESDRSYHYGEYVSGTVVINVKKDISSRRIVVAGYWKSQSRNYEDKDIYFKQHIPSGSMRAGRSYEFHSKLKLLQSLLATMAI